MIPALIALLTAFSIDSVLGDPPNRFHPVAAMGSFIRYMTKKGNRGGNTRRFVTGMGIVLAGGILFSFPWIIFTVIGPKLPGWAAGLLMGIFLKPMFASRGLLNAGREVHQALVKNDLAGARRLVAWHLVSRDTSELSSGLVASATIESLTENLTDSFLAPLFYFALGGLPLAWFYRFVNTADAMIGYHSTDLEYFGKFAARLDDILNWLPARSAAFLLVLSAGLCKLNIQKAYQTMGDQHRRTSSPNAGWSMSAAAGALGIILEKPGNYRLEGGPELPDASHILKALHLVAVSQFASLFFCGGLILGGALLF
jgi:adenosylcobinamide-phosphate synthase